MRKILLCMIVLAAIAASPCWAESYDADLTVGNTSIEGGFHLKRDLANGFWRTGGTVLYTDENDIDYKWVELDFTVGSETMQPGLTCEVGLKGVIGEGEDKRGSGDVGTVAFAGRVGYVFPQRSMPVPIEAFAGIAYAPEILSFRDTENYLAYYIGIGVRIVQNASIVLKYNAYDVDMDTGGRKWDIDDSNIRFGLVMRF